MVEFVRQELGAPFLYRGRELRGEGAMIGVVDTGFDTSHPSLSGVVATWDMARGPAPTPRQAPAVLTDRVGHGTHVAAIAAGRSRPIGLAPGVDVGLVCFDSYNLPQGVQWLFEEAEARNQPVVVNISQGGYHGGPHDGSDPMSRDLDSLVGPGRLIVAAAGNERDVPIHCCAEVVPGVPLVMGLQVHPDHWEPGGEDQVRVTIYADHRAGFAMRLRHARSGHEVVVEPGRAIGLPSGDCDVKVWRDRCPDSGRDRFSIVVLRRGHQQFPRDTWFIYLSSQAPGSVHAWCHTPAGRFSKPFVSSPYVGGGTSTDHLVASPAAAKNVIAVGSSVIRQSVFVNGQETAYGGDQQSIVASYSAGGPSVDGRRKPDLLAPGHVVTSARSAQTHADRVGAVSPDLTVDWGTSQAAPVVTGLLALALSVNRHLDTEGALDFLANCCQSAQQLEVSADLAGCGVLTAPTIATALEGL